MTYQQNESFVKTKNKKTYTLIGADNRPYQSEIPGTYGGHRKTKIYGRMDCPAALRAIEKGGYVAHRVFFAEERTAMPQDTCHVVCAGVKNI